MKRLKRKYPLLDEGNRDKVILVSTRRRPVKLSGDLPIQIRKVAWRVRQFPRKAAGIGAHLIWPDGTSNTIHGWFNQYRQSGD